MFQNYTTLWRHKISGYNSFYIFVVLFVTDIQFFHLQKLNILLDSIYMLSYFWLIYASLTWLNTQLFYISRRKIQIVFIEGKTVTMWAWKSPSYRVLCTLLELFLTSVCVLIFNLMLHLTQNFRHFKLRDEELFEVAYQRDESEMVLSAIE